MSSTAHRRPCLMSVSGLVVCLLALVAGCASDGQSSAKTDTTTAKPAAPAAPAFDKAFYRAAEQGNRSTVQYRLDRGAPVNATNPETGWTALQAAAANGHKKLVTLLLSKGADPNLKDRDGNTALHLASMRTHDETTAVLVPVTDLTIRNNAGKTAKEVATMGTITYFPAQ